MSCVLWWRVYWCEGGTSRHTRSGANHSDAKIQLIPDRQKVPPYFLLFRFLLLPLMLDEVTHLKNLKYKPYTTCTHTTWDFFRSWNTNKTHSLKSAWNESCDSHFFPIVTYIRGFLNKKKCRVGLFVYRELIGFLHRYGLLLISCDGMSRPRISKHVIREHNSL